MAQADFEKPELNNRNHSGNCQRLFNLQFIAAEFSDLRAFVDGRGYYYPLPFQGFFENSLQARTHTLIILHHFEILTGTLYCSLPCSCFLDVTQRSALRDIQKHGCEGDYLYRGRGRTSPRLHRQALHRLVLRAKCFLCSQALCLLYLSHPPETGKGEKRPFDKMVARKRENVFWYLAFFSSQ